MTLLAWLAESAALFALLTAVAAGSLYLLRVRAAAAQLRVWTVVLLAGLVLPFVPAQWVMPINIESVDPVLSGVLFTSSATQLGSTGATIQGSAATAASIIFAVYAGVAALLLLRLGLGSAWATRLRMEARSVAGRTFLESDRVTVPVTVGVISPVVIVPATWRAWSSDTLDAVLHHEGDHAARRDGLWLTLARAHRALHWLNPLSWWLSRHIATLSERASDDAALVKGITPTRYAEIVLGFAADVAAQHRRVAWVVPMARHSASDTEDRLHRVLSWKGRAPMTRARVAILVSVLVVGAVATYTATWSMAASSIPVFERVQAAAKTSLVLLKRTNPKYTPEALREKIDGIVEMAIEISAVGEVTSAKVTKSLDATFGLDEQALLAVKQWQFAPQTVDGKAVPASVTVQMEFRIHKKDDGETVGEPQPEVSSAPVGPVLLHRVHAKYTPAAMRAKIQGIVRIEAVVNIRGEVTNARILESLDAEYGLDAAALAAVSQWRYQPSTFNGHLVPVVVTMEVEFRLH